MKKLFSNKHLGVFIFIVTGFILLFLSVLYLYKETDTKFQTITHYKETNKKFDELLSSCYEMEATTRGYTLTKDIAVAETYGKAKQKLENIILSIDSVREINELETEHILTSLVFERIHLLDSQMNKADSLYEMNKKESSLIIKGDIIMDKIRTRVFNLKQNLESRIYDAETSLTDLKNNTFIFIILSVLFASIFIMISYYRLIELSESNEKQKLLVEEQKLLLDEAENISSCGSWKWDLNTNETVCSQGTYKIFEIDPNVETIDFEVFNKIIHFSDRERIIKELSEATSEAKPYIIEHKIETRESNVKIVQSIGKPKIDDDGIVSYYGSIRDITLLKVQEEELLKRNEELVTLNENLQQFTYIASHDLQEPLRKIQTFAMLLKEQYEEKAPGVEYVDRMHNASERMRRLISDLLDFSRVSRSVGKRDKVDLNNVVKEVLENFDLADITLKIDKLPTNYKAHRTQMIQLFQNLISNAIKFKQEKKQLKLTIECSIVKKEQMDLLGSESYEISITDNGIGFDSSYSDKIFDMFQRLHSRSEFPGTGIGLAICKKIVENHEGFIKVNSTLGTGSVFRIYLPTNT